MTFLSKTSVALAILAFTGLGNIANAQTAGTQPGVNLSVSPGYIAPMSSITMGIWGKQESSGIGSGYNVGGDGKGTVKTFAEGVFHLGANSNMAGNSNPSCTADCNLTQSSMFIQGEQLAGARADNQGVGNGTVSAVAGTNTMFNGAVGTIWYKNTGGKPTPQPLPMFPVNAGTAGN